MKALQLSGRRAYPVPSADANDETAILDRPIADRANNGHSSHDEKLSRQANEKIG
jgi:hypothetical protein